MNHKCAIDICRIFNLGILAGAPTRVHGGLLHIMWRLTTNKASYAIKQLSQDINLNDESVRTRYEQSEFIADSFAKQGIPIVSAICNAGKYVSIIGGVGFLVYPWIEAKALVADAISEPHALIIAGILAKMHQINLNIPDLLEVELDFHNTDVIIKLINQAKMLSCPFANDLIKHSADLLALNDAYIGATSTLKTQVVISHADLDQKNVLWDINGNPILIDWESARKINITYDIINTAFDWSGIATNDFNQVLLIKIIAAYKKMGGLIDEDHLEAAFYGVIGNCINWLVYNIKRSCITENSEQKNLGVEQVSQTLIKILHLQNVGLKLMKTI